MLVYMTRTADDGQGLYFYSLDEQCTFACLKNAELFIHCYDNARSKTTNIVFLRGQDLVQVEVDFKKALEKYQKSSSDSAIQPLRPL